MMNNNNTCQETFQKRMIKILHFQAMHLLHSQKGCIQEYDDSSPLDMWVKKHGAASLLKYNEKKAGSGTLKFYAESLEHMFEAVIDPENQLSESDKLSQVRRHGDFKMQVCDVQVKYYTFSW